VSSMKKGLRRAGIVGLSTVVATSMMSGIAVATPTFSFDRLAGADRYATSVAVAVKYGETATHNVILASGETGHYPDALTASTLAGSKNAPILLTRLAATPANVLAQIAAVHATDVYLVGGTGVISAAQATALGASYTVHRLGGADRYATSKLVIGAVATPSTTAVLATGVNFPDAIAGGPLSYVKGMPLAITRTSSLPAETLSALQAAGVKHVIALGGPTVITQGVLDALAVGGIDLTQRIYGADRAETSSRLADYMIDSQGFTNTGVNLASGYDYGTGVDALSGAPLSGQENRPTLITRSNTSIGATGAIEAFMTAHKATLASGHIFGGTGAISTTIQTTLEGLARAVTSNQAFTVSPTTSAVMTWTGGDPTTSNRAFSMSGLDNAKSYTISFVPSANVSTSAGTTKFVDADATANVADGLGTGPALITLINGAVVSTTKTTVSPVGGTISFTLQGTAAAGSVVPVVFLDTGATVGQLDLVVPATANLLPKAPAESFSIGGVTTYAPAAGTLGTHAAAVIGPVDTTAKYYVAAGATYTWDSNDVFKYSGVAITQAQFESMLNVGDTLDSVYSPTASGVSTFNISNDIAVAPAGPVAAVVNLDAGATINDVQITFTPDTTASPGTTYQLRDAGVLVTGTTQAAGSTVGTLVITKLNATNAVHTYTVNAVSPVSDAVSGNIATAAPNTTVPGTADVTKPTSTTAVLTTNAGLALTADAGDVWTITYNEAIQAPVAGTIIQVSDGDAVAPKTVANFVNGTNATFALDATAKILTVTITSQPAAAQTLVAGTVAGVQYPALVIDSSNIKDLAGNSWDLTAGDITI
jgi:putative cell wall-binding protein